jgi:hypothetical protein
MADKKALNAASHTQCDNLSRVPWFSQGLPTRYAH